MALQLADTQKLPLTVRFVDNEGEDASVQGSPAWTSSDDSVISIQNVGADGMSCEAVTTGKNGSATVTVTADADLGDGSKNISGTLDLQVVGMAAGVRIEAGAPVDR